MVVSEYVKYRPDVFTHKRFIPGRDVQSHRDIEVCFISPDPDSLPPDNSVINNACLHASHGYPIVQIVGVLDDTDRIGSRITQEQLAEMLVDQQADISAAEAMAKDFTPGCTVSVFGFIAGAQAFSAIVERPENGIPQDPDVPYRIDLTPGKKFGVGIRDEEFVLDLE